MRKLAAVIALLALPTLAAAQEGKIHFERASLPSTGGTVTGNVELRNPDAVGPESFGQPVDFSAGWTADGAVCAIAAGSVKCTGPGTGTFTQTSANAAANGGIAWASAGANGAFVYAPTISNVAGTPACTVTTAFAAAATAIPNATASTQVVAKAATVGDFVTSCVLGAGATIWFDAVSLKQIIGGNLTVQGRVLVGNGTVALPALSPISDPTSGIYFTTSVMRFGTAGTARWLLDATGFYPAATDLVPLGGATRLVTDVYVSRSTQGSKAQSLTDAAAAVSFVRIAVPTNANMGGDVIFTATSTDGANGSLTRQGRVGFAGANIAGTVTCGVSAEYGAATAYSRANTLLCTVTAVTSTTNCDLQVTCTDNKAAAQTVLFNYRLDMPIPNTVTPQ